MISIGYGIVIVPVCCSVLTPSSLKEPESREKLSLANTASFFRVDLSSSASLVTSSITSVSSCSVILPNRGSYMSAHVLLISLS